MYQIRLRYTSTDKAIQSCYKLVFIDTSYIIPYSDAVAYRVRDIIDDILLR